VVNSPVALAARRWFGMLQQRRRQTGRRIPAQREKIEGHGFYARTLY
jgi:hypothetical protein